MTDQKFSLEYKPATPGNGLGRMYVVGTYAENSRTSFTLEEFIEYSNMNLGKTPNRFYFERTIADADLKVMMEMKDRLRTMIGESFEVVPAMMNAEVVFSINLGKITVTKSRGTASGLRITL